MHFKKDMLKKKAKTRELAITGSFCAFLWCVQAFGFVFDIFYMLAGFVSSLFFLNFITVTNFKMAAYIPLISSFLAFISFPFDYSLQLITVYIIYPFLYYRFGLKSSDKIKRTIYLVLIHLIYPLVVSLIYYFSILEIMFPSYKSLVEKYGTIIDIAYLLVIIIYFYVLKVFWQIFFPTFRMIFKQVFRSKN